MSEGSPVTKPPLPKPRTSKSLPRNSSESVSWSTVDPDVQPRPRGRSSSYSSRQGPQPKPRRPMTTLFADGKSTASADSSPQTHRLARGPVVLSTADSHTQNSSTCKQSQVTETPQKVPASPKTIKSRISPFKNTFSKRQRASSESKVAKKPPPQKPPPYIPKKLQQQQHSSLRISQSKTPPARRPPQFTTPPSTDSCTISPLRNSNAYTPNPSLNRSSNALSTDCMEDSKSPQKIDLFKVKRQNVIEKDCVHHDYEELDSLAKKFDSSSSLEYKEPEKTQLVSTLSAPALPPRSNPPVPAKKHRRLASPAAQAQSPPRKVEEQDTGNYLQTDDKPDESDRESDDSYISIDPTGGDRLCLDDEQEDVYVVMNPAEFIEPPNRCH